MAGEGCMMEPWGQGQGGEKGTVNRGDQSRQAHQGLRRPNSLCSPLCIRKQILMIFHGASLTKTDVKSPNELR